MWFFKVDLCSYGEKLYYQSFTKRKDTSLVFWLILSKGQHYFANRSWWFYLLKTNRKKDSARAEESSRKEIMRNNVEN